MYYVIMLSLIVAILFGLGITFFAFQNSILVPVNLTGTILFTVPLYLVMVISVLAGIIMAWIISLADSLSHFIQIQGKESVINNDKKIIQQLKEENQNLEKENVRLLAGTENQDVGTQASEDKKPRLMKHFFRPHFS